MTLLVLFLHCVNEIFVVVSLATDLLPAEFVDCLDPGLLPGMDYLGVVPKIRT